MLTKLRIALVAIICATVVTGCVTTTTDTAVETNGLVCTAWKPIFWSRKDTDKTIIDVKENNARQKAWCKE